MSITRGLRNSIYMMKHITVNTVHQTRKRKRKKKISNLARKSIRSEKMAMDITEKVKRLRYFTKKGPNSWFVQSVKGQYMESFYVSIVPPGGTIVMTGDYDGVIVNPYCGDINEAIRWMAGAEELRYFAEKVGLGNQAHKKKEYTEEKACKELGFHFQWKFCQSSDNNMNDVFAKIFKEKKYCPSEFLENLALAEETHPDSYPQDKIEKIEDAVDCVIGHDISNELEFYELYKDLEGEHGFSLTEIDPTEYTYQLRWQHQCLMWWAKNVMGKQKLEYFELEGKSNET